MRILIAFVFICAFCATKKLNSQTLIYPDHEEKDTLEKFTPSFSLQNFDGFGKEQLSSNFKKKQIFVGIEGNLGFKKDVEILSFFPFVFLNMAFCNEQGIDNTPLGKPDEWNENELDSEVGLGFKIESLFTEKKNFGIKFDIRSTILHLRQHKSVVLSFEPQLVFKKNNFSVNIGNKFESCRDGMFRPFILFEYEHDWGK